MSGLCMVPLVMPAHRGLGVFDLAQMSAGRVSNSISVMMSGSEQVRAQPE